MTESDVPNLPYFRRVETASKALNKYKYDLEERATKGSVAEKMTPPGGDSAA